MKILNVMKLYNHVLIILTVIYLLMLTPSVAQNIKREQPKEWNELVYGGRFMDRFLPMPSNGDISTSSWGTQGVHSRYIDNGLEDETWSYWGGNVLKGDDDKFHLFACRWREDAPKGHKQWPQSYVIHAVCDNSYGAYRVVDSIGKGHNPEIHQLLSGKYFLYVNGGYYLSNSVYGPWNYCNFVYDQCERPLFENKVNFSFARRENGSFIMVGRGGEICFSKDGLPPYFQVNSKTVYPPYEGRFEDPVIWKTNIQYHLIVNDWMGRIAYYLRSKDGVKWKVDAGEAYLPGIARHKDGHVEEWYKFERIKVLQDEYGRAVQANFAVADTIKSHDRGSDNHSSKNICIPLTVGRLIKILNHQKINNSTKEIQVLVKAEENFDPHKDIDINSLRFGASEEVNFGKGSKVIKSEENGKDLIITFSGNGNGISDDNFTAKLLGKNKNGELLFGYARLPWLDYNQPALSALYPRLSLNPRKLKVETEFQNFGQIFSKPTPFKVVIKEKEKWQVLVKGTIPSLQPFETQTVSVLSSKSAKRGDVALVEVVIFPENQDSIMLEGKVVIR